MPRFGSDSMGHLLTTHADLQRLFQKVVKGFDCKVIYGHRTVELQQTLYAQGRTLPGSIVTYKDGVHRLSNHNHFPALAVDVVPYPVDWKDTKRMHYFAGYVRRIAEELEIKIRWGGDWDDDTRIDDEKFVDLPHFELLI